MDSQRITYVKGNPLCVDEIVRDSVSIHLESMGKGQSLLQIHDKGETLSIWFTAKKGGQLYVTTERLGQ